MDFTTLKQNLTRLGYAVSCFDTAADAAAYLDAQIDQTAVGFGGSVTLQQMGMYERLGAHNTVYWHWKQTGDDVRIQAATTPVYLSSVNAIAETGEIINIDGNCNRVASIFYGHERVYLIAGENKIAPDYDAALHRARNVAAPLNAQRIGVATPCAKNGDRCYDCHSPARICCGLSVLWKPPMSGRFEVALIHENLGY